ncbi:hypothetical protein MC885_002349, partial [Smutsia gigantea]
STSRFGNCGRNLFCDHASVVLVTPPSFGSPASSFLTSRIGYSYWLQALSVASKRAVIGKGCGPSTRSGKQETPAGASSSRPGEEKGAAKEGGSSLRQAGERDVQLCARFLAASWALAGALSSPAPPLARSRDCDPHRPSHPQPGIGRVNQSKRLPIQSELLRLPIFEPVQQKTAKHAQPSPGTPIRTHSLPGTQLGASTPPHPPHHVVRKDFHSPPVSLMSDPRPASGRCSSPG